MTNSERHEFFLNKRAQKIHSVNFTLALVALAIMTVVVLTGFPEFSITTLPLMAMALVSGMIFMNRNKPAIIMGHDTLEMKLAPLAARIFLKASEVEGVSSSAKRLTIHCQTRKDIRLPKDYLEPDAMTEFESRLETFATA